jgi:hypothetical protein
MTFLDRFIRPAPAPIRPAVSSDVPITDPKAIASRHLAQSESRLAQARLGARCLLSNGREFPCIARHVTMTQAEIHTPEDLPMASGVVLYLDVLGLVHGQISRPVLGGYIVTLKVTRARRAFFASRLETAQEAASLPEERAAPRIVPARREIGVLMLNGREFLGEIADVSYSGIAIKIQPRPAIGVDVAIGQTRRNAVVVRHTEDGVALRFACPLNPDAVTDDLTL